MLFSGTIRLILWNQSNGIGRTPRSGRKVKAIDVFGMGRQKNPSRLGRRSRLAAAAEGGRVAHKGKYSSERDQPAAEPPMVTTVVGTELGTSLPIGLPQHY
jgi:hypothetical protein